MSMIIVKKDKRNGFLRKLFLPLHARLWKMHKD